MASTGDTAALHTRVGERYRLVDLVSDDGFAATWEAIDERLERRVLLRGLSTGMRTDEGARENLRQARHSRVLPGSHGQEAPRILDGGEDSVLGPFLVAELTDSFEATRPLPTVPEARPTRRVVHAEDRDPTQSNRRGLVVLAAVALVCVAAILLAVRTFAPAGEPALPQPTVAPEPTARPKPGSVPGQAAVEPTAPPTLAAPQVARATAAPTSTSAPLSRTTAASPTQTIQQHYALITARDYAAGYRLMSSRLQRLNSPAEYAGWFANKVSVEPVAIEIVSQTDDEAVVRSTVDSTDRIDGAQTTARVREEFVLRKEGADWRIDQVTRM